MNNRCKKINFQSIIHKRSIKFDCHILKKIVTLKLEKGENMVCEMFVNSKILVSHKIQ